MRCLQVLTGNDERVATWRQLAQSWQDMWLKWDSEQDSRKADAQADVGDEERMAFVNSLLAQASTPPPYTFSSHSCLARWTRDSRDKRAPVCLGNQMTPDTCMAELLTWLDLSMC